MKLFFAATVVALASQASAFKVVYDNESENYCLMVVKNDGSTDWQVDGDGNINALPSGSTATANEDGSPTIAQNGVNDPTGDILDDAQTAFTSFISDWATGPNAGTPDYTNNLSVTVYEAGGASALTTLVGLNDPSGTLSWCRAYSTMAPDHYCKADGAVEPYQEDTLSTDIQECCNNNHGGNVGMENTCIEVSTGKKNRGDAQWYIGTNNDKCVRNCDVSNLFDPASDTNVHADTTGGDAVTDTTHEFECGGLLTWQTSYSSLATCCSTHFADLIPEYCDYLSEVGSEPDVAAYAGTGDKWYSDASNSICKKDCATSGGATCGGVVTKSYIDLYDSAADCCSTELPWLTTGCVTRSESGEGVPTDLYWPDPSGCRQDCSGDPNCSSAPTTAKIYATDEECCKQANSWVNIDYCKTRADPNFPTSGGSDKWYVSYENGVCRKDCDNGTPQCELADNGSLAFFDSEASCCKALLGSNDEDACIAGSTGGLTISTVPTNKWYVSTSGDQPCAQDCATGTGAAAACGGIVAKTGIRLYDTETECCDQAYGWLNEDLCVKESQNEDVPTDLWYVDYNANACKKDCTVAAADPKCDGRPDDIGTPMYSTADLCCSSKLNWIPKETCVQASTTGIDASDADSPGTGEWRKNTSWSACVLDCRAGETIETGDPIIGTDPLGTSTVYAAANTYPPACDGVISDSSAVFYGESVENCCKSINYVQEETCVAISTDTVSEMFFVDPSDRTKCLAHQAAAVSGSTISCDASGVVDGGTAGSAATGVTCEDTITTSTKLYASLDDCCEANVNWDKDSCIHDSRGTEATGTSKYYVDWSLSQCVQDCPDVGTVGSSCGGIAKAWDVLYADSSACCNRLSWLSRSKCIYVKT